MSLGLPLSTFFSKLAKVHFKFENTKAFLKNLISYTIANSPQQLSAILKNYSVSAVDRENTDNVFLTFPSLNSIFVSNIQAILDEKMVMGFLEEIEGKKSENIIKMGVREWVNRGHNYWKVLEWNFGDYERRKKLIKLGLEL